MYNKLEKQSRRKTPPAGRVFVGLGAAFLRAKPNYESERDLGDGDAARTAHLLPAQVKAGG